jgi:hypothetical protein
MPRFTLVFCLLFIFDAAVLSQESGPRPSERKAEAPQGESQRHVRA